METVRLLLVEDNFVDVLCLKEALEEAKGTHFVVSHVEILAEARERLEKEDYHVVVLDLGLPDSQGLETFEEVRDVAPTLPIVVLSGLDDETLAMEAVRKGAQDYILKSKFDSYYLSRSINYAIERCRLLTDQKKAEQALRLSEQRFRAIFEGAEDYIFVKDRSSKYINVNPAVEKLFGLPASEIIGRRYEDLFGEDGSKHSREADLRVLQGESIEAEHTRKVHGTPRTFLDTQVPLRNDSGEIVSILCMSRDISERRGIEVAPDTTGECPSTSMQSTLKSAMLAAKTDIIVLLLGESGSGKDHLARYIHDRSHRADGPYFSVNCAAISKELAESELFGHERGAFTGAHTRKRGLLELAEGGTLLLNEIGELSLPLQAKLLTFLDTKKLTRVGGEKEISVNARLIAATNRDLQKEVEEGRFRKDLFYRLDVMSIAVPPLRERQEDIPILVQEILSRLRTELEIHEMPSIDPAAIEALKRYHWPGNVRELRNVLERALILSHDSITLPSLALRANGHLNFEENKKASLTISFPSDQSLNEITQGLKRFLINEALRRSGGSRQGAAKLLGISRYSLKHYMNTLGYSVEE
ncbi:MAG TPA: sigma 54-interacting transcriptional regulator [Desulfomonilaceae bacterium]|nr:sigma 54-interacting transcriptional regulator [Desulfomonilaceae bacterium]